MGLRFRKSISLFPGLRLNFSKSGMSVSTGIPGFRKTINTKGQVTTTIGIPGTGLYYVDTRNSHSNQNNRNHHTRTQSTMGSPQLPAAYVHQVPDTHTQYTSDFVSTTSTIKQVDANTLKSIHKTADDTIDWTEILVSPTVPDDSYNQQMWSYYYSVAPAVLNGDIDTYLKLIYEVNPLDDLIEYVYNVEFGTDDPDIMEVEYTVNTDILSQTRRGMNRQDYNDLLQDFLCSLSIRIARDLFALLPINHTIVHTVIDDKNIMTVDFDRQTLSKVKFGFIDPSDTVKKFTYSSTLL